jgi:hypothetical protein
MQNFIKYPSNTHSCISSNTHSGITSNTYSASPKFHQTPIHMHFIKHPFWHYIKHPLCITKIPSNTHSYAFHQTPIVSLHQTPTLHHQNPIKHKLIKHPFMHFIKHPLWHYINTHSASPKFHQTQTHQTPVHMHFIKHPLWHYIKHLLCITKIPSNTNPSKTHSYAFHQTPIQTMGMNQRKQRKWTME